MDCLGAPTMRIRVRLRTPARRRENWETRHFANLPWTLNPLLVDQWRSQVTPQRSSHNLEFLNFTPFVKKDTRILIFIGGDDQFGHVNGLAQSIREADMLRVCQVPQGLKLLIRENDIDSFNALVGGLCVLAN